jgi:hypothetical protein
MIAAFVPEPPNLVKPLASAPQSSASGATSPRKSEQSPYAATTANDQGCTSRTRLFSRPRKRTVRTLGRIERHEGELDANRHTHFSVWPSRKWCSLSSSVEHGQRPMKEPSFDHWRNQACIDSLNRLLENPTAPVWGSHEGRSKTLALITRGDCSGPHGVSARSRV